MQDSSLHSAANPHFLFTQWFDEARAHVEVGEPTAMCLATCFDGIPSSRMVLLKHHDASGFVFYTNLESRKSKEISGNPNVALCFYWQPLDKQVRITGTVEAVSDAQADAYFASRSREKQIGAWASQQSRPMTERADLETRVQAYTKQFANAETIPRPQYWSGWRVVPHALEFWEQRDYRLHERCVFTKQHDSWDKVWLYP